jgi:hypothetical protein
LRKSGYHILLTTAGSSYSNLAGLTGFISEAAGLAGQHLRAKHYLPMALSADEILVHPALAAAVRIQTEALLMVHRASPRLASPFATQKRWLMSLAALSAYFRSETQEAGSGVLAERLVDAINGHDLASRNTAAAFINEMLKYDIIRQVPASEGKRYRPLEPSPSTLAAVSHWGAVNLATLDALDGGLRAAALRRQPQLLGELLPLIADGLLSCDSVRRPDGAYSLFTWTDDGSIVMDRLIVGCRDGVAGLVQIPTDVTSVSALAKGLNLSRSHLGRKFSEAVAMGSLGWSGTRGKSALWVSAEFWRYYHAAQAVKLATFDAAFAAVAASGPRDGASEAAASA